MTKTQLLCSPFRCVEYIIQSCCLTPLPDSTAAKLKSAISEHENAFLMAINKASKERDGVGDAIDYSMVMPLLNHVIERHLYGHLKTVLPGDVMARLQNELLGFPILIPTISWDKLLNDFLSFHGEAFKKARIADIDLGLVDDYVCYAFTDVLLYLIDEGKEYDQKKIDDSFIWVLSRIEQDSHTVLDFYYEGFVEESDLKRVVSLKHSAEKILRQLEHTPESSLIPNWAREHSPERTRHSLEKLVSVLKKAQSTIEERKAYGLQSDLPPSTPSEQNQSALTKRQRILLYFYEDGKMVERRHKDYNDYNNFSSRQKRFAFPNESHSKLKHLIKDIEKVIPHLSENYRQSAESELNTLKARLSIEN